MDTTKSHGFFLAGFLLFMFLGDLTEACSCGRMSIRTACCLAHFVMRTKFMSVKRDPQSPSYVDINMFSIQPIEVYKGPGNLTNTQFLYTPLSESFCGYIHKGPLQGADYLISGTIHGDRLKISSCSVAKPWKKVTDKQKRILKGLIGKGCSNICLTS